MEKGELHVRCPSCQRGYHLRWRPGPSAVVAEAAIVAQGAVAAPPAASSPPSGGVSPLPMAIPTPGPSAEVASPQEARRAKRFARALAESILQGPGRRERRDRALAEGRLLQEFRAELSTAWRLYVDKVGEDVARSSSHFKDAFNEILADGQPLF